jgi:hypothetical protein
MVTRPVRPRRFRFLGERFTVLILGSLIVGIALYVVTEWLEGIPKSVVSGLASALFALGAVTFASEYILKTAFTEDVLDISDLKHEVYNAGIQRIADESDVDWSAMLESTRRVDVVALRPSRWQATMWPQILRSAGAHPLTVSVIFVDPISVSLTHMAHRLGVTPESYADEIKRTAHAVENEWKREKAGWANSRSTLQIGIVDAVSTHSIVRVDGSTCLIAEPVLAAAGSQATLAFIFRDVVGISLAQKWLAGGIQDISERCGVPLFSDVQQGS